MDNKTAATGPETVGTCSKCGSILTKSDNFVDDMYACQQCGSSCNLLAQECPTCRQLVSSKDRTLVVGVRVYHHECVSVEIRMKVAEQRIRQLEAERDAELKPLLDRLQATTIKAAMLQLDDHFDGDAHMIITQRDFRQQIDKLAAELAAARQEILELKKGK